MKIRFSLLKIGFKKGLSSKLALAFLLFSAVISFVVEYSLWQSVLQGRPRQVFQQTISYLLVMQFLSLLFPKASYEIYHEIANGDIAIDLIKPLSLFTKLLWEDVGYSLAKLLIIGIPEIILYCWILDFKIPILSSLSMIISGLLAYLLYYELELLIGTFSFYTYSIWGITTFKSAILLIFSGNLFPANFYPPVIKALARCLPFEYTFGAIGLLAQNPTFTLASQTILIQLGYVVLFYLLWQLLFKHAVNSIVIQGG
ncbi:ABC-2 family transporter protein [Lactobacillus sp. ESL0684]|uniref:ABC transporter permease n=1 Tax=Lactobacillus sp. ESL0684 TaxID=2983213 RepID=UPI0023F65723|nr:ABC-2 family transporter protein [Lactobacillus sp. ESL0684]WEV44178.1 ABC-2 family transporter protein [Lactobacillus sp. ESL0684]